MKYFRKNDTSYLPLHIYHKESCGTENFKIVLKVKERKGKRKKEGTMKKKQKLYIIVTKNRFIIMSKMNNMSHQIKCYSMK